MNMTSSLVNTLKLLNLGLNSLSLADQVIRTFVTTTISIVPITHQTIHEHILIYIYIYKIYTTLLNDSLYTHHYMGTFSEWLCVLCVSVCLARLMLGSN